MPPEGCGVLVRETRLPFPSYWNFLRCLFQHAKVLLRGNARADRQPGAWLHLPNRGSVLDMLKRLFLTTVFLLLASVPFVSHFDFLRHTISLWEDPFWHLLRQKMCLESIAFVIVIPVVAQLWFSPQRGLPVSQMVACLSASYCAWSLFFFFPWIIQYEPAGGLWSAEDRIRMVFKWEGVRFSTLSLASSLGWLIFSILPLARQPFKGDDATGCRMAWRFFFVSLLRCGGLRVFLRSVIKRLAHVAPKSMSAPHTNLVGRRGYCSASWVWGDALGIATAIRVGAMVQPAAGPWRGLVGGG